jgi:hypothetical protein
MDLIYTVERQLLKDWALREPRNLEGFWKTTATSATFKIKLDNLKRRL